MQRTDRTFGFSFILLDVRHKYDTKFSTLSDSGLKTRFFKDEQTSDASDHSRTKISKIHR